MDGAIMNRINKFFEAGPIEAGLEVGADSGLSAAEYIQVPKMCIKKVSYKLSDESLQDANNGVSNVSNLECKINQVYQDPAAPGIAAEWMPFDHDNQRLVYYSGKMWVLNYAGDGNFTGLTLNSFAVEEISSEQWVTDNYKAFIAANKDVGELVADDHQGFFHSCRLMSLLFGVGLTEHDKEWRVVDDPAPAQMGAVGDDLVNAMVHAFAWAPTAICVRAAMFRKTKHATGGSVAQGFAQKLIVQMGWPWGDDAQKRASTGDFYKSTHAASPVALLAMISPKDLGHFGIINPMCGIKGVLKSLSSVSLRVVAPDQISGAAMISDSFVVVKMLKSEGLLPLLKNLDQLKDFCENYALLRTAGFRAHNSYGYYVRYHPVPTQAQMVDFNQRNPSHWPLVCELAIISKTFYKYRTISKSPSLQTAANSSEDAGIDTTWKSLSSMRSTAPPGIIASYYHSMKGSNVSSNLQVLVNSDTTDADFKKAVEEIEKSVNKGLEPLGVPDLRFSMNVLKQEDIVNAYNIFKDGIPEAMLLGVKDD